MFRQIISQTPLTTEAANTYFENITGQSWGAGDFSFLSTLRALVHPRMGENDHLRLYFGGSSYSEANVSNTSTKAMVQHICNDFDPDEEGVVYIHQCNHREQTSNYACLELLKASFTEVYSGWQCLEKVTEFYRKAFYVLCFINPETKSVAVFSDTLDYRKMHYLQCSIFAFLPWYFDPEVGVTQIEMDLIQSLREKTSEKYTECIAKISEQFDFRGARIKHLLNGFEIRLERIRRDQVRGEISDKVSYIGRLNSEIGEYLAQKERLEIELLGLEDKISAASDESEIMNYFLCNKKLQLERVDDSCITFVVRDHLAYFNEDIVNRLINNTRSCIYRNDYGDSYEGIVPIDKMERFMKAVFIDQLLKIRVCAAYSFAINGNVSAMDRYNFDSGCDNYMPNPHIDRYRCMGNYQRTINELLMSRDYIGAIEQCIASCKSLNFADITVMHEFMECLYGTRDNGRWGNCIELPDGRVVNIKEAVEWMDEQEEKETEE